jgi:hypothetical protein
MDKMQDFFAIIMKMLDSNHYNRPSINDIVFNEKKIKLNRDIREIS